VIQVQNITKSFGTQDLFRDASFLVAPRERVGIVGRNGCGKSTLGRTMIHLLDSTDGQIFFQGKDVTHVTSRELYDLRENMQIIFQDPYSSLNPRQTIAQILTYPMMAHGASKNEALDKAKKELDLVGLPSDSLSRYPHEFSGGQRQRIGIARSLMVDPKVIIADEVTSALDVSVQAQVLQLLEKLRKELGISLVFISHDLLTVRSFADNVIVMYKGHEVEKGVASEVLKNPQHLYTQVLIASVPTLDFDRPPQVFNGDPSLFLSEKAE